MQSKDNTCPTCLDVGGSTYPCLTCGKKVKWTGKVEFRSGQQEDKPTKAEQCYRCGCAPCRCGEDDSKPEKPEQLAIAVEGIVDDIVTHAYHHPPVPKEFYRARIKALLATEYDRGKVEAERQAVMVLAALLKSNGGKLTIKNSDIVALDNTAAVERYEDMNGIIYRLVDKGESK